MNLYFSIKKLIKNFYIKLVLNPITSFTILNMKVGSGTV